jgi:hypothetical protein
MGSGHFLVEATDYLARELVRAWAEARPEEAESEEVAEQDVQWAKREVVRRCIYGVDLNPMAVELAKLSMWLSTVAANKPLTFLDHHLKVGNSLIGAKVNDLKILPTFEKKRKIRNANAKRNTIQDTLWNSTIEQHFDDLIKRYAEIAEQTDDDLATVKKKQKEYNALKESELNLRFHELANVWLSVYFENDVPPDEYAIMQDATHPDYFPSWDAWRDKEWFGRAQEIAQEKRFYHWELEFPEVFYTEGAPKENPGWDAVVGNPPWGANISFIKNYLLLFYSSKFGELDSHIFFTEKSIDLLRHEGLLGYITPNTWLYIGNFSEPRKFIYSNAEFKNIVELEKYVFKDAPDIIPLIFVLTKKRSPIHDILNVLKLKKGVIPEQIGKNKNFLEKLTDTAYWDELSDNVFNIHMGNKELPIIKKIETSSEALERDSDVTYGIKTGNNKKYLADKKLDDNWKKALVTGNEVSHYEIDWQGNFLDYGDHLAGYRVRSLEVPKICVQYIRKLSLKRRLVSCIDVDGTYYPLNNFSLIEQKEDSKYSLYYKEGIINSKTMNFYFKNKFIDYNIKPKYISQLPIRRIPFTTPPDRRTALVEEAKTLYSEFLGTSDNQNVLDFVGVRLETQPEESDVVHDLLAYLAERMIEVNKEKNAEIKIFLSFLEGEIGVSISDLSNKTAIKRFYNHEFQKLIDILSKNRKKFKEGYDPKTPTNYKHLLEWYTDSVNKLEPLMSGIEATDNLIDRIVYMLYGLNEDEIKIVKESVSNAG